MIVTCIAAGENRRGDESDLRDIDLEKDVYFIQIEKKIPVFHTKFGKYFQIVTLDGLYLWLRNLGFEKLDSVNLVKLDKIKFVDPVTQRIHFENGVFTSVSKGKFESIIMQKFMHLITKNQACKF